MPGSSSIFRPRLTELPGLLMLCVMIVLPVAWMIGYSLLYSLGGIGMFSRGWTTSHWRAILDSGELWRSLLYSAGLAAGISGVSAFAALGFVLLAPEFRHRPSVLAMICLPLATPAVVMAVMVYQILNPGGLVARVTFHMRLIESPSDFPVMVSDFWALGILLAGILSTLPLLTLFFLKTWTTARIDHYCRLAESLGATHFQSRWNIAGPMLLSRGRSLILLTFLWNLGSYEIPLLLGRQSPQMCSVLIQRRSGQYNLLQRPEAFALATVYLTVVCLGVGVLLLWRRRHE